MAYRLTKSAKDYVQQNSSRLYGPLCEALKININSVQNFINRNSRRLIELPVLQVISDHSGLPVNELIEVCAEGGESEVLDGTDEQGKKLISELQ